MDISVIDLLYLTLAVTGYATAATMWTYFARPVREGEAASLGTNAPPAAKSTAAAEFFDEVEGDRQAWQEAPGTR